jgi:hypothetical protein
LLFIYFNIFGKLGRLRGARLSISHCMWIISHLCTVVVTRISQALLPSIMALLGAAPRLQATAVAMGPMPPSAPPHPCIVPLQVLYDEIMIVCPAVWLVVFKV